MLSDVEIARNATPIPVTEIAAKLGYAADDLECYGKYKAKVPLAEGNKKAKLVLVTAMNPTLSAKARPRSASALQTVCAGRE